MPKKFLWLASLLTLVLLTGEGCISFGAPSTGPMGMFRSADKGESWQQANTYPTVSGVKSLSSVKIYQTYNDPSDPNTYYMGTRGQGLFYTLNNGDSWETVPALNGKFIYGLAVDPTYKCTVYVTDGVNIFKTSDCLRTWKTVYTEQRGQRVVSLSVDFGSHNTVYAGLFSGDVVVSANGGDSWRVVKSFGFKMQYLVTDQFTPGRIYVASVDKGLYRSDDGGGTWTDLTPGLQSYNGALYFYRLIVHPSKKDGLFWLSKYGILHSEDAGKTWTDYKLLSPPGAVNIYSFAVNPNNLKEIYYVGTILGEQGSGRSTFYKSTDGGNNWVTKKMPTSAVPISLYVHPLQNNVLFMGFTLVEDNKY